MKETLIVFEFTNQFITSIKTPVNNGEKAGAFSIYKKRMLLSLSNTAASKYTERFFLKI